MVKTKGEEMGNDKVFEYLSNICQNKKDVVDEYQALFFKGIEHFTTQGKNIKLDFLLLFTISIFNQRGTPGFLGSPRETIKLSDPDYGTKDKKKENKLWGRIPKWLKGIKEARTIEDKLIEQFVQKLKNWFEEFKDPSKKNKKYKDCLKGVNKFKEFIKSIKEEELRSFESFWSALSEKELVKRKDDGEIESQIDGMGEKTFGLFIEQIGFYAKGNDKLKKWLEECEGFPLYGFSERYIKRFLRDVYEYYANRLYEEEKFKNFHLNSPVSIDVLWNAYRKGNTLDKYLEKENG